MPSRLVTINDDTIDLGRLLCNVGANQASHQEDGGEHAPNKPGLPSTDLRFSLHLNSGIHLNLLLTTTLRVTDDDYVSRESPGCQDDGVQG